MNRFSHKIIFLSLMGIISLTGCNKFLEEKSDKSLGMPNTVADFRALLSDWSSVNSGFASLGEASSDDIYLSTTDYNGLHHESDKRLYVWAPDNVNRTVTSAGNEWSHCYKGIYVCNAVLQGLDENNLTGTEADHIRGQALVFRAARYLDAVQIWAPIYDDAYADQDLGMVIRLDPDMNLLSVRSSVRQTYDQILSDLHQAVDLLPSTTVSATLPRRAAAHGLLARAYLIMGDYELALSHAEAGLEDGYDLIDFNDLNPQANFPIPVTNQLSREIIFFTRMYASDIVNNLEIARVSDDLLTLYGTEDLRNQIYFREGANQVKLFKGTHMGHRGLITGITSSELLLIAAECHARGGNPVSAADALNLLLVKRFEKDVYVPIQFNDPVSALQKILEERRKELVFRGLRWSDIKRLNRDGGHIVQSRTVGDQEFILEPNDKRYAIAIPEDIIETTGIIQNPR